MPDARRLIVASAGLDGRWKLPRGAEGAAQAVERLGYVQIDTIAVIQRAHHHTLWSRRGDYTPAMLHRLQAEERRVFEYWTHAASYVPMCHYRYYLPRMRAWARSPRARRFMSDNASLVRGVLSRIRAEGPLISADFAAPPGRKRGPWWDWKPAKHALELLFATGKLMVAERRNFQRVYDLTDRVLPAGVDTAAASPAETARFVVRRVLACEGISNLRRWWIGDRARTDRAIAQMIDAGEVASVQVAGVDGRFPHYALTESLAGLSRRRGRKRLHLLSPFDNMVIWRGRLETFFDFHCKLECYLPAARRRYGYFCLPILWGERFIGRLDPKADRKDGTFIVRKLIFEPGFTDHDAVAGPLAAKLNAFARFNECERIVIKQTTPRKAQAPLKRALGAIARA
ncbi:hypothetical protein LCGC14_2277320 [marine sediment metagenome]|uniref:Winged helix-turn-helix domain-containing protein n=1 Tax=marine sediment metagenome TaxID=412755 RepID=A0A0F9F7R7_9ZZZZ